MISWNVIIPINLGKQCKTRLATRLDNAQRDQLVIKMAIHVVKILQQIKTISKISILSPIAPDFINIDWIKDNNRGLNIELADAFSDKPTLIIHADLPFLTQNDVEDLLKAAQEYGAAIASDYSGSGTNAIALLKPNGFKPQFGANSLECHKASISNNVVVKTSGLSRDIDTPTDFDSFLASNLS